MSLIQKDVRKDGITILTLNRPEVHNSFSRELLGEFTKTLKSLEKDEAIRIVILTGAGDKSFSSGVDLKILQNFNSIEDARDYALLLEGSSEVLFNFTKPVITAINGYALGGGLGYAASTDFRIAADTAKMGFPAVKLGAILPVTCTLYLSNLIGLNYTRDLLFTGRMVDAHEAYRIGLVNRVVAKDDLMQEAVKIAQQILEGTDMALFYTKRTLNTLLAKDIESQKLYAADNFAYLSQTKEWKERIMNFGKNA
ncbi:MAG: enoyl-CoA hydratase/isomerase family protein [Bacteroidales bacterium]|nr:enoyl-CoA hydratase/isomerase family protein [Bacteroidales bacterium]